MTKSLIRIVVIFLTLAFPATADDATLHWKNGDSLSGTLLTADENSLTWQSPMFADPLQIELPYLANINYPGSDDVKPDENEFRIEMWNGDMLSGRLKAITGTTMSFESARFGSFEAARSQIRSLHRLNNSGVIFSGLRGLKGWQAAFRRSTKNNRQMGRAFGNGFQPQAPEPEVATASEATDGAIWSEQPDGSIITTKSDAAIFLPLDLPEKFEVELEVHSTNPVSFLMVFGHDAKHGLRIATWIDELVAAEGKENFRKLTTIGEEIRSIHLYVFVNQAARTIDVYSDTGDKLGELDIAAEKLDRTGLMFRNGDFDLSIDRLRVNHWDGNAPRIVSDDDSRIELADGTLHFGKIQELHAETGILTLLVDKDVISVPVADVGSLVVYGASGGSDTGTSSAWLNWNDGGFVSGSLVSVTDGTALIQTSYSKDPLRCVMNGLLSVGLTESASATDAMFDMSHLSKQDALDLGTLRRMKQALHRREAQLNAGDPAAREIKEAIQRVDSDIEEFARERDPSAPNETDDVLRHQPDRLFHKHGTLQGRLVVEGAADAPIQWTPLGGLNASTLQGVENARFVRASDVMHLSETPELLATFPDVVYLRNNDVLPCRIEASTEDGVQLTSPLTDVRAFPRDLIRAVELSAAGRIHQRGFAAEGWLGFNNRQKDTNRTKLEFVGNSHYSHPDILTGDTVRFRLEWPKQSWSSLTVSLFGTGQRNDTACTHVCFGLMPNQIQILDRPQPQNQMMMGMRMGGGPGGNANDGIVAISDSQANVQILTHDGNIIVSIDGQPAKTIKMNASSPGRRGIAFNGNVTAVGRVIVNGRVAQRGGEGVTLSNFEVDNLSGASIRQFIEEESRQAALTIPRFRRDNPPTHVLIAPNGDLLRGRLLGIEGDKVVFESRLETLRFERSRVGAVVWLDAPETDAVKAPDTNQAAETVASSPATAAAGDADSFASDVDSEPTMQAQLADGFSVTMKPSRLVDGRIEGSSAVLGRCSFPARAVRELCIGNPEDSHRLAAYDTWVARMAREPDWDIPQSDGGSSAASALIGTTAANFELPMLDGTTFRLSDHQDKVVVLDFWATWCGPCVMALPDYIAATSKFDESKVIFVAVNLQESSDQIRSFLAEKQLSPHVALDRSAAVAPAFQVSGIPHTVILGPGNVIEDVHVGYQPGSGETMQTSIQQLLDGTWKRAVNEEKGE